MAEDRAISVRLNGHNYSYWSSVFKNFVVGKEMWGHIAGSVVKPSPVDSKDPEYAKKLETYLKDFAKWEVENAKILTWFHNSVEPSIGMNFSKYETAKEVWDYLKRMYLESNFAKQYELEGSIRRATQGEKTIQEFYNEMTQYWDQVALMEPSLLQSLEVYVEYREKLRLVQFLMALRDEFEPLHGAMLHRSPQPTVDGAVHELIAEETRFKIRSVAPPSQSVFAAPPIQSQPQPQPQPTPYMAPLLPTPSSHLIQVIGKPKSRVGMDECSFCRQKGHWKHACPKLLQMTGSTSRLKPSSPSSRPTQQHSRPTSQYSRPPTAFTAPATTSTQQYPSFEDYQQFRAFLAITQGGSSQASAMTTTQSGLHGSYTTGSGVQEADWDRA